MKNIKSALFLKLFLGLGILGIIFVFGLNFYIKSFSQKYIFSDISKLPESEIVMILGAKTYKDGTLSDTLKDRTEVAIKVFQSKKTDLVLVSADNGRKEYDEVRPVRDFLIKTGIKSDFIFLDFAGFSTYDSMYRAKNIFGIKKMIISTQKFHLPRAVRIARKLGIEAYGIEADGRKYYWDNYNKRREFFANIKSFLEVIFNRKSYFTGKKIPITGKSNSMKN